jgi:hypothetical protein
VIFTRRPVSVSPEQLAALTGEYDLPFEGLILTIAHKSDGRLFAQVTGQSETELIVYRVTENSAEFTLKDQPNASLEFVQESEGTLVLMKQFGVVYRAPRVSQN